jgi:glycosyltransferase involved in cell wall biosynthesis
LRVLFVHNRYQELGGEDRVVAEERALLDRCGWETRLWSVSNDVISGAWQKVVTALRTPYSRQSRLQMARIIADFAPEVVHIHNFFPLLSPSIYDACRASVAVVQSLHNYRPICAGGLLMRDGHPCEDCVGGSAYQAVLHGCYRGSHLGSFAVARMVDIHRRRGTWSHKVDRFIAPSAFVRDKFIAAGFPADRLVVKPHFAAEEAVNPRARRGGALFVGRLSPEKGVGTLLKAWRGLPVPLRIVGDGPLRGAVENSVGEKITMLGRIERTEVAQAMTQASFLVAPSISAETFGLVVVEAFCQGLPVIASRIGALPEIIEDGVTGLLFSPGDAEALAAKVSWAYQHPEAMGIMGVNARKAYEEKYSPTIQFVQLKEIYEAALLSRAGRQRLNKPARRTFVATGHAMTHKG